MSRKKRIKDCQYPDLFRMSKSGTFYLRYTSKLLKRRVEVSLRTKDRATAIKRRNEALEHLHIRKCSRAIKIKNFEELAHEFFATKRFKRPNTIKVIENQIKHLLEHSGNMDPEDISQNDWFDFVEIKKVKGIKSFHNARKYLSAIMRYAHEMGYVRRRIRFESLDFTDNTHKGKTLTQAEFEQIKLHLNEDWRHMADMAYYMGMRITEIKKLEWDRVNFFTKEIILRSQDTKTKKMRRPVMPPRIESILKHRYLNRRSDRWVFCGRDVSKHFSSSDRAWQLAKKKAGFEYHFHHLRHTFLTNAFRSTNRYADICAYAGCTIEEAEKTYLHFTRQDMSAISEILAR